MTIQMNYQMKYLTTKNLMSMTTNKQNLLFNKLNLLQLWNVQYLLLFIFYFHSFYTQVPPRPNPPVLYNNLSKEFPNFLSTQEAKVIEEKLEQFSRETSNQIAVIVVDDFNGYTAAEYATMIGEQWGVGKKDKDNGIVVLIKPTGKVGERELFIAVGLGLEGAIPDLATKKIRENIMQPLFAEGRYFEGLNKGLDALMKLAKGEISEKDLPNDNNNGSILLIIIIVIIILWAIFRKNSSVVYTSGRGSYWGGRSFYGGGGGSSWGSSSGGWSGFGGGSFGGGGSGGKW